MGLALKDTQLKVTKALPNGAAAIVSDPIDLGHGSAGDVLAQIEFKLSAPALVVGDLANNDTMKFDIIASDNADMSSPTTMHDDCIIQTGAASAGAAAATFTGRVTVDCKRYVAARATNSGSGDASDKSLTFEALL